MARTRKYVANVLLRAGLPDLAAKAEAELPDPVEEDECFRFAERNGLTRDWMASRMGGSP
jgi:hypothetical protein